jgi:hypothetical protein
MSKPRDEHQKELFRPVLDQTIDLRHPLVLLAEKIDLSFTDGHFRSVCHKRLGQPPLPTRLVAGLQDQYQCGPNVYEALSSRPRTRRAPATIARILSRARFRGSAEKPQSAVTVSFSAGTNARQRTRRAATSSGVSR